MKINSILTAIVVTITCMGVCVSDAAIIAQWTFETSPPADLDNSTTISGINADSGSGVASGFHAGALTDWSTPAGNGSANSLSANTWATGDYFQFTTSTEGFESIVVTWSQHSSGTGPTGFKLQYSTDGSSYADFASYAVIALTSAWNPTTHLSAYDYAEDLSGITALNNDSDIYFRLVQTSATGAASGTSRIDDFTIHAVPEPAEWGLICAMGLMGVAGLHSWRERRRGLCH